MNFENYLVKLPKRRFIKFEFAFDPRVFKLAIRKVFYMELKAIKKLFYAFRYLFALSTSFNQNSIQPGPVSLHLGASLVIALGVH